MGRRRKDEAVRVVVILFRLAWLNLIGFNFVSPGQAAAAAAAATAIVPLTKSS